MIFSELIERMLYYESTSIEDLANELNIPLESFNEIYEGINIFPQYSFCYSICKFCVQNEIPFDDFDWNEVVYEWFTNSALYKEYTWADDIDESGYIQLKHNDCGRRTRIPISELQSNRLLCLHCWVEKQNISTNYTIQIDENNTMHRISHNCGKRYNVTYKGFKSKAFRCPVCTSSNKTTNPLLLKDSLYLLFSNDTTQFKQEHYDWEIFPEKYSDFEITGTILNKYKGYEYEITIPSGITVIGESAFGDCEDMEIVTIPSSVKRIESRAFKNCSNLQKVIFAKRSKLNFLGKTVFSGCYNLNELLLPRSVMHIENGAFSYISSNAVNIKIDDENLFYKIVNGMLCTKESNILIECFNCEKNVPVIVPNYINHIGERAFASCYYLEEIIFEENSQLKSIGVHAFDNCDGIKEISIPSSVEIICNGAFYACKNIKKINFADNSKLEIIEESAFESCYNLTEISIPCNVKILGKRAFNLCENLLKVEFMDNCKLQVINSEAFYGCTSLRSITIPSSVEIVAPAFDSIYFIDVSPDNSNYISVEGNLYSKDRTILIQYACGKNEKSFNVPNSVEKIGKSAFYCCENLSCITFSENLKEIKESAFSYCGNLSTIIFDKNNNLEVIGNSAFSDCGILFDIELPDGVISIGDSAFKYCSNLKTIVLPNTLQKIGDCAFYGCDDIKLNMCEGISYIGNDANPYMVAIKGNSNLRNVSLPNTTTIIYCGAFKECESLENIFIPNSVINIGNDAFNGCECLKKINIPESVNLIGKCALRECEEINVAINNEHYKSIDGVLYTKDGRSLIQYPINKKDITFYIPNTVLNLEEESFMFSDNLQKIFISKNVIKIGYRAFYACDSLTSLIFDKNSKILVIDDASFESCKSVEKIEIPESIKFIGVNAFAYCSNLSKLEFGQKSSLQYIGKDAFYDCGKLKNIKIPVNAKIITEFCKSEDYDL